MSVENNGSTYQWFTEKDTFSLKDGNFNGITIFLDKIEVDVLPTKETIWLQSPNTAEVKIERDIRGYQSTVKEIHKSLTPGQRYGQGMGLTKFSLMEQETDICKDYVELVKGKKVAERHSVSSIWSGYCRGVMMFYDILGKNDFETLVESLRTPEIKIFRENKTPSPTDLEDEFGTEDYYRTKYVRHGIRMRKYSYVLTGTNDAADILKFLCIILDKSNELSTASGGKQYYIVLEYTKLEENNSSKVDKDETKAKDSDLENSSFLKLKNMVDLDHNQVILTGAPGTGKSYLSKLLVSCYAKKDNRLFEDYSKDEAIVSPEINEKLKGFIRKIQSDYSYFPGELSTYVPASYQKEEKEAEWFTNEELKELCQSIYQTTEERKFWVDVEALRGMYAFVQFHPSYDYSDFVEGIRPVPSKDDTVEFRCLDGNFMSFCRYVAWRNKVDKASPDRKYFFLIDEINRADLSKVLGELMFCLEASKRGPQYPVQTQYANLPTYFPKEGATPQGDYFEMFKNGFYIPENVVVIGTMNDIDRSVESMDFALRRRFTWEEVRVTESLLTEAFENEKMFSSYIADLLELELDPTGIPESEITEKTQQLKDTVVQEIKKKLISALVGEVNHGGVMGFNQEGLYKKAGLGEEYYIAQGYFADFPDYADESADNIKLTMAWNGKKALTFTPEEQKLFTKKANDIAKEVMEWVWNTRVQSLIREYLRGSSRAEENLSALKKLWKPKKLQVEESEDSKVESETIPSSPILST